DHGSSKDHGSKKDEDRHEGWKHDKPRGGVHTGGGGLTSPGSTAAGGLVLLGGLGAGAYMLRRRSVRGDAA
ncbi:hypothetical protein ACPCKS_32240, partial [Streptomyces lavendulocolor]